MKRCTACGQEKPLSEFYREPRVKDGRTARCKDCYREGRKKKTIPRKPTERMTQLAAILHVAHQMGNVDVTACVKAARRGFEVKWL